MIDLIQGDCLEKMWGITDKSQKLIFADLPQQITKNHWDIIIPFEPLWKHLERLIKDDGVIVLMTNQPFTSHAVLSNLKLFRYSMVWEKPAGTDFLNSKKKPLKNHEDILIFYKFQPQYYPQKTSGHKPVNFYTKHTSDGTNYGKTKIGISGGGSTERYPKTVLKFSTDKQKSALNATQKPVALIEWFIKSFTVEGDNVLDPCCGSGTTLEACKNLNRNGFGIEKDEIEYKKAKTRLKL